MITGHDIVSAPRHCAYEDAIVGFIYDYRQLIAEATMLANSDENAAVLDNSSGPFMNFYVRTPLHFVAARMTLGHSSIQERWRQ